MASLASQSLYIANGKGVRVEPKTMAMVDTYTQRTASAKPADGAGRDVVGDVASGSARDVSAGNQTSVVIDYSSASAGVPLYQRAQELEQLSRTDADRKKNAPRIAAIKSQRGDARFVTGFGSIGAEEFFSYLASARAWSLSQYRESG